ncbi:MAG: hypothetical protein ACYC99_17340 [Candidatus Geothermincolia bacterium]
MTVTATWHGREIIYTPGGWAMDGQVFIKAHMRGHFFEVGEEGCFFRDGAPWDVRRPCKRCGRPPTPEGHDACLGHLPGVRSACCGHGVTPGLIIYNDGHEEREEQL